MLSFSFLSPLPPLLPLSFFFKYGIIFLLNSKENLMFVQMGQETKRGFNFNVCIQKFQVATVL